ncbi:MAG: hypothetical protein HZB76_06895 [Chlamydiae bacterium]|nr:hypothetical protein [Chlamydiota bacterium]
MSRDFEPILVIHSAQNFNSSLFQSFFTPSIEPDFTSFINFEPSFIRNSSIADDHYISLMQPNPFSEMISMLVLFTFLNTVQLNSNTRVIDSEEDEESQSNVEIQRPEFSFSDLFSYSPQTMPRSHELWQQSRVSAQDDEAIRRAYGISDRSGDAYGHYVDSQNNARFEAARENSQEGINGERYIKDVLEAHKKSLSSEDNKKAYTKKLKDLDSEIFIDIPREVIHHAIQSKTQLSVNNTPKFLHKHINELEQLRKVFQHQKSKMPMDDKNPLWKDLCAIAMKLSRDADFSAPLQVAIDEF